MENKNFWEGTEIAALPENGIFVFGSNPGGIHGLGSAKVAETLFGAKRYVGRGMSGASYALVTKNLQPNFREKSTGIVYEKDGFRSVSRPMIVDNIAELYDLAAKNPDSYYFIAYVEKGETWPNGKPKGNLNGYTNHEMAEMFIEAGNGGYPENIIFNESYEVLLDNAKVLYDEWIANQARQAPVQPKPQPVAKAPVAPAVVKRSGGFQSSVRTAQMPTQQEQFDDMPQPSAPAQQASVAPVQSPAPVQQPVQQRPRSGGFQSSIRTAAMPVEKEDVQAQEPAPVAAKSPVTNSLFDDDMPSEANVQNEVIQPVQVNEPVNKVTDSVSSVDDNFDDMPQASVDAVKENTVVAEPVAVATPATPATPAPAKKKEFAPYPNVPLVEDLDDPWGEGLVPDVFLDTNPDNIFMRSFYQVDEAGTVVGKVKVEEFSHEIKNEIVGKVRGNIIPPEFRNADGTMKVIEKKVAPVEVKEVKPKAKAPVKEVKEIKQEPVAVTPEVVTPVATQAVLSPSEMSEAEVPGVGGSEPVVEARMPSTTLEQDGRKPFVRLKDMPESERAKELADISQTPVDAVVQQESEASVVTSEITPVAAEPVKQQEVVESPVQEPVVSEEVKSATVVEEVAEPEVQATLPDPKDYTFFFHLYSEFSNFHPSKFESDGIQFCSNEQYMMLSKAYRFGDTKSFDAVLEINNREIVKDFLSGKITKEQILKNRDWANAWNEVQKDIKAIGKNVTPYDDDIWSEERKVSVREGLVLKFSQNPDLLKKLLATGNTKMVEASPYDKIWGIGLNKETALKTLEANWPGENILGTLLDSVRDELRLQNAPAVNAKQNAPAPAAPVKGQSPAPAGDKESVKAHPENEDKNFFYSLYSPFSNFHPAAFVYKDVQFSSSEQFYMFAKAKFSKNEEVAQKILDVNNHPLVRDFIDGKITKKEILSQHANEWFQLTMQIKNDGKIKFEPEMENAWNSKKENIMKVAIKEKFLQNDDLSQALVKSGGSLLVESSPRDKYWGAGLSKDDIKAVAPSDWPGLNRLGNLLTEFREVLRNQLRNQPQEPQRTGFRPK